MRSYMRPMEDILAFDRWWLVDGQRGHGSGHPSRPQIVVPLESRRQRVGFVVRLENIASREQAEMLIGASIAIPLSELPELPPGEYYWEELVGLSVVNLSGTSLGMVDHLLETGANDVLVVHQVVDGGGTVERLVPWIPRVIRSVELVEGILRVDWDPED